MRVGGNWLVVFLVSILLLPSAFAYDHLIINSQDWRDVYTGMQYGSLTSVPSNFLVSTKHSTILLYSIPTTEKNILVISNRDRPFVVGYQDILRSRGYTDPEEIRSSNLNLELLKRVQNVSRFVIIDDAYGYNAISVAPFSVVDRSFVIFTNRNNIDDIVPVLSSKNPTKVLIYGQVDREVKDALAQFSPETINKGNRFDNNIEIVNRYLGIRPTKQAILTNGEFIEAGIMTGADPVVFLGKQNVPESVRNFIKESDIDVGILIGNELVNSATFVRRTLGISVFVKFAQGARQPTGAIATVEDLDRFPMPKYDLDIEATSIVYNRASGTLLVTYHNTVGLAEYFKSTITLRDGTTVKITGDNEAVFIDKNEYKTIAYTSDIDNNPLNMQATDLSGDLFVVYGESPVSLENTYQKTFQIETIEVLDDSKINVTGLYYDRVEKKFYANMENIGQTDAYVGAEIIDLNINGEAMTFGSDEVILIKAGDDDWLPFSVELVDADIAANQQVKVRGFYGERELSRFKITEGVFQLELRSSYGKYAMYGVIVLLILLILLFLGTKKKCKHCGHKNARGRNTCIGCGQKF